MATPSMNRANGGREARGGCARARDHRFLFVVSYIAAPLRASRPLFANKFIGRGVQMPEIFGFRV